MREYDIYLPTTQNDGTPIASAEIDRIKEILTHSFGGYTHFDQQSEGAWRIGGVTFRDAVTIVRVLDNSTEPFDMQSFKLELEKLLRQESVLIVAREVEVI